MSNKRVVLIFPDGVGIKNYLYSDVFKNTDTELIILHNFDDETQKLLSEITSVTEFYKIPKYIESFKEKFLRELICLSRLKYNSKIADNATILSNWKTDHKGLSKKVFYKLISKLSTKTTDYKSILKLEKAYQKSLRNTDFYNQVKNLFSEINPDLVFCAHQRGLQCATIFAVAEDQNISNATVIYSWDNLPKARMALKADKYLVWSVNMKDEMHLYYPEISSEQVVVSGTPQFEFYGDSSNITPKDEFYKRYELDVDRKIICFSGDDTKTSPDDPKYLFDLASEMSRNNLQNEYQILLRRCPVDFSGRFNGVIKQFPNLIKEAAPIWSVNSTNVWSTVFALPDDIALLVSTAFYSDIVVNVGSTMAFDFAMFKKPCVFIAYDQEIKVESSWSVDTIYKFQHFRTMPNNKAVIWWTKKDQITNIIKAAKYVPETDTWMDTVLGDYKHSSSLIADTLKL
ncbi:hypothetical protein [Flavobacterium ardleyense]|uniref:hypothetical protein n=1 Tax=Flavobacterium ardleyense TaxID=2038737 RepID=UPI00298D0530|nr:hypothetical protein [Flavobacterium ardleyense]